MDVNDLKLQFKRILSVIVENIHGRIRTIEELKRYYESAQKCCIDLRETAKSNKIYDPNILRGWNPYREWEEISGENRRGIKFLKEEVYPIYNFYEKEQPTAKIRCFNDDRNYDAELISPSNNTPQNHIEISFPRDGQYENCIETTISTNGIWVSAFEDDLPELGPGHRNGSIVLKTIKKKAKKEYPDGTILIIMGGSTFPHCDDFDSSKPDPAIERYWDNIANEASKVKNSFVEIWLIDRQPPNNLRQIK